MIVGVVMYITYIFVSPLMVSYVVIKWKKVYYLSVVLCFGVLKNEIDGKRWRTC
jgi:hypothetical protein